MNGSQSQSCYPQSIGGFLFTHFHVSSISSWSKGARGSIAGLRALSPEQCLCTIPFLQNLSFRSGELRNKEKHCQGQTKPRDSGGGRTDHTV